MTATATAAAAPGSAGLWSTLTSLRSRFSFRYSATGRSAAALVTDGHGTMFCEYWRLHDPAPGCRPVDGYACPASNADLTGIPVDAVPFDDGSVLVVNQRELVLVAPDGTPHTAGALPFKPDVVAAAPDGSKRVLFLGREGTDPDGPCSAWLLPGAAERARRLGALPALLLRGGGWLDAGGSRFAVNLRDGGRVRPAAYDLGTGECVRLEVGPDGGDDIAWLTAPGGGEVLLASERDGGFRLRTLRGGRPARTLASPDRLAGLVTPMAMRHAGGLAALLRRDGLRDELVALDTDADAVRPLPGPAGRAVLTVAWAGAAGGADRLWALSVGSGFPATVVGHQEGRWFEVDDGTPAGRHRGWAPSHLETMPGSESAIDVVVCGHEDWRSARQVVLALHGGPASRWSLKFEQLFQVFAAEGVTIVAPNPRGSVGYGEAFHRLIVDAWAGPDLADVLAVARHVQRERGGGRLALYGPSYGAFLALLAACVEPRLWSRVLAVAPMLSGARLYAEAPAEVRAMIDRLGGRTCIDDELGPRDLIAQAPKLAAPLAIVHGDADDRVPVTQSRALVAHLESLGRARGGDFHYHEVPGAGHAPLDGSPDLYRAAAEFVARGSWTCPPPALPVE